MIRITTAEGQRHGSPDDPPDVRSRLISRRSVLHRMSPQVRREVHTMSEDVPELIPCDVCDGIGFVGEDGDEACPSCDELGLMGRWELDD